MAVAGNCPCGGRHAGRPVAGTWSLDFALPLTFIAIVAPLIRNRAMLAATAVSRAWRYWQPNLQTGVTSGGAGRNSGGLVRSGGSPAMSIWWTMLACGMVTLVIRLSFIAAGIDFRAGLNAAAICPGGY